MKLNLTLPLNTLSFGFCGWNIFNELLKREEFKEELPSFFPITDGSGRPNIDLKAYNNTEDFVSSLNQSLAKKATTYDRSAPYFKLWHINGSESSPSDKRILYTFYELDSPTETEINILNQQDVVMVSSRETKQVFEMNGVTSKVVYCPLGFDKTHFKRLTIKPYPPEVTVFGIFGKFENRKNHIQAIQLWLNQYANKKEYVLHLHTYNSFFSPEDNNSFLAQILQGRPKPFNVVFYGHLETLQEYNQALNAVDVVIDMSGGEGFSLPSFHCLGLGNKLGIIHNCSAMKDWANKDNAIMVEPQGKRSAVDGMFFHANQPFNVGNIYNFNIEQYTQALKDAVEIKRTGKLSNFNGHLIQEKYTWQKTVDIILNEVRGL